MTSNDEIFSNSLTDENGYVVVPLEYQYGGDISVTVTKQDCKPYIGTANIRTDGKLINVD